MSANLKLLIVLASLALPAASLAQERPQIDSSGKGAVLCTWSILIGVQATRDGCHWVRTASDDALDRGILDIDAFIIENSSSPVTPEQLAQYKQREAERMAEQLAQELNSCTVDPDDITSFTAMAWGIRMQPAAEITAGIADMLSIPREPVMNPCL